MDVEILNNAIDHFGKESQISKAIEEMAELITELARCQNNRGMNVNLIEEIADVSIMMAQLREIFGPDLIDTHIGVKLRRLKGMIQDSSKVDKSRGSGGL